MQLQKTVFKFNHCSWGCIGTNKSFCFMIYPLVDGRQGGKFRVNNIHRTTTVNGSINPVEFIRR